MFPPETDEKNKEENASKCAHVCLCVADAETISGLVISTVVSSMTCLRFVSPLCKFIGQLHACIPSLFAYEPVNFFVNLKRQVTVIFSLLMQSKMMDVFKHIQCRILILQPSNWYANYSGNAGGFGIGSGERERESTTKTRERIKDNNPKRIPPSIVKHAAIIPRNSHTLCQPAVSFQWAVIT